MTSRGDRQAHSSTEPHAPAALAPAGPAGHRAARQARPTLARRGPAAARPSLLAPHPRRPSSGSPAAAGAQKRGKALSGRDAGAGTRGQGRGRRPQARRTATSPRRGAPVPAGRSRSRSRRPHTAAQTQPPAPPPPPARAPPGNAVRGVLRAGRLQLPACPRAAAAPGCGLPLPACLAAGGLQRGPSRGAPRQAPRLSRGAAASCRSFPGAAAWRAPPAARCRPSACSWTPSSRATSCPWSRSPATSCSWTRVRSGAGSGGGGAVGEPTGLLPRPAARPALWQRVRVPGRSAFPCALLPCSPARACGARCQRALRWGGPGPPAGGERRASDRLGCWSRFFLGTIGCSAISGATRSRGPMWLRGGPRSLPLRCLTAVPL